MTIQEKIDLLAAAALRSAPPARVAPQPTTYMAPFEKPKTVALVAVPEAAVVRAAVESFPASKGLEKCHEPPDFPAKA